MMKFDICWDNKCGFVLICDCDDYNELDLLIHEFRLNLGYLK